MSATLKSKDGHASSNNSNNTPNASNPSNSTLPPLPPSLPKIGGDLENYLRIARQIETALAREREELKRYREEFYRLRMRHSNLTAEVEAGAREFAAKEELLKSQLFSFQKNEKTFQEQILRLNRHIQELTHREENLKAHLATAYEAEKRTEKLRAETSHNLDQLKQEMHKLRMEHASFEEETQKLKATIAHLQKELARYQTAWTQVSTIDAQAKKSLKDLDTARQELEITRQTITELENSLSVEKKHREKVEELLNREKREKQLALAHLQNVEAKIAQMEQEAENRTAEPVVDFPPYPDLADDGLKLEF